MPYSTHIVMVWLQSTAQRRTGDPWSYFTLGYNEKRKGEKEDEEEEEEQKRRRKEKKITPQVRIKSWTTVSITPTSSTLKITQKKQVAIPRRLLLV